MVADPLKDLVDASASTWLDDLSCVRLECDTLAHLAAPSS